MASSAHHARTPQPLRSRALLRAGLAVSAAGAALVAGGASEAVAAPTGNTSSTPNKVSLLTPVPALNTHMVKGQPISPPAALGVLKNFQPNPWAQTPADPLNNKVETQVADFKPVSTGAATDGLSRGDKVKQLPVLGTATKSLPG